MNRLSMVLVAFALGMVTMDVVWVQRLAPMLNNLPNVQQPNVPAQRPPRVHLT